MAEPRTVPRHMSAGVILVDSTGRVLMQLRDDDPAIMFPGHWGLTGGAAQPGETPEQTARREVREETGLDLARFQPFRAYYFSEERAGNGKRAPVEGGSAKGGAVKGAAAKGGSAKRAEYELYLYHAPCTVDAGDLHCGEGRELRFFAPGEVDALDIAYNHREVLADFFTSPLYARYVSGAAFEDEGAIDPVAHFTSALDAGAPWFDALMEAIAIWERPYERAGGREYRYLVGGEAFDWLLLAERLLEPAYGRVPGAEIELLLFDGVSPGSPGRPVEDARLRELMGEHKHRAHLNFVYGVTVEEALQYATELEVAKERVNVSLGDGRDGAPVRDPVFERIYDAPRMELLARFREERGLPDSEVITLADWREFEYWLFKYRVKNSEPARVASDTRKALAQLSAITLASQRRRERRRARAEDAAPIEDAAAPS